MRIWLLLGLAVAACGDNLKEAPDAGEVGSDGPTGFVEATHAAPPQVISGGGSVLATPTVVPIFFTGDDTTQAAVEDFLGMLTTSSYWTTTTSEYGVGAITIAPTIVSSDTPPTTDADLETWLSTNTDGTHVPWPVPDANTIYAVFLPEGVVLSDGPGDTSCVDYGGYHSEDDPVTGQPLVYALLPRCGASTLGTALDSLTSALSHELIEASTDPTPFSNPVYTRIDPDHYIWGHTPGAEIGDMCEYVDAAFQKLVGPYLVQRTWSNASAAAGHDPCVPVMNTPYVAAVPELPDDIAIMSRGAMTTTKGLSVPVGVSKMLELDLFSDAETVDFNFGGQDAAVFTGGQRTLDLQWGTVIGNNGTKAQVLVTRTVANTRGNELEITATVGGKIVAVWWAFIGD